MEGQTFNPASNSNSNGSQLVPMLGTSFAALSIIELRRTFTLMFRQVEAFIAKVRFLPEALHDFKRMAAPVVIPLDKGFFVVVAVKERRPGIFEPMTS